MFKKPKRNYRGNRRNVSDDDGDYSVSQDTVEPTRSKQVIKQELKAEPIGKARSVLSFHDDIDEDCEVFKVKKSSHSKKVAKRIKEETKKEKEKVSKIPEDKRSDPLTNVTIKENFTGPVTSSEIVEEEEQYSEERLKRLRAEFLVLTGDEAAAMEDPDEEPTGVASMLKRGIIPDATTIHMAKKQRELAKQRATHTSAETEAEANSGSGDKETSRPRGSASASRLVREDDDDVSSEEEERIQFTGGSSASNNKATVIGTAGSTRRGLTFGSARSTHERELQALREQFLAAEQGSGDEDEAAVVASRQWERQQIEKALPGPSNMGEGSGDPLLIEELGSDGFGRGNQPIPSLSSRVPPGEITVDSLKRALEEHITSLETVNSGHRQELEQLRQELADSEKILEETQTSMPRLEQESRFFQEMEAYSNDFIQCCNEKVPKLEFLEKKILELSKTQCNRLVERRRRDIQDETLEVSMSMSSTPGSVPSGDAKEEEARRRRSAEREARRMRRRRWRETKQIYQHNEGMSSDEELPSAETMKWNGERDAVLTDASSLFDDVFEQFSELGEVMSRFARWRDVYPDTYIEAYIGRCLPKLCSPLIRLKMVSWNPLSGSSTNLERMPWFSSLLVALNPDDLEEPQSTGKANGEESVTSVVSDDVRIIPYVVERTIIPRLRGFISNAWDPLSSSQTSRLVNFLQVLVADYPSISKESKEVRRLLEASVFRMRESLENDVYIPLYPRSVLQNKLSAPSLFLQRQFWSAVKLLGNILAWSSLLSDLILQSLAIDMLLSRYIIVALVESEPSPDFLMKIVAVHSTFPREWFEEADACPACLHNFVRFIERTSVTHFSNDRETMSQITRILDKMKATVDSVS